MCEICGAQFARSEYRARHIAGAHYKETSCKICFRIFPNNSELLTHAAEHSKKKVEETRKVRPDVPRDIKPALPVRYDKLLLLRKFECDICQRRFIRKQHMLRHRDTHSDIRRYQCVCCHKRFSRREYHEKHQSECAKKNVQLGPETGQLFDFKPALEGSTGPKITGCGEGATSSISHDIGDSLLNSFAMETKNPTPNKIYPCDTCERVFVRYDHLKRHRDTHSSVRPFNCSHCPRVFSHRENQQRHESQCKLKAISGGMQATESSDFTETTMDDGSDNAFDRCEIGEPNFAQDFDHDGDGDENDLSDDTNGKINVNGNGELYTIISDSKKLKVNSCPICSRDFTRTDHLKRHIQTHDGIKRYQCRCCRKFFSRQDYQLKHEKVCLVKHTSIKLSYGDQKDPVPGMFWELPALANSYPDMSSITDLSTIPDNDINDDFAMDSMADDEFEINSYMDSVENKDMKYTLPELSRGEYETLSCDTCSRVFQKRHHLRRHKIGHMDSKPIQCTDCDKKFTRMEHMKRHLVNRHNKVMKRRSPFDGNESEKFLANTPTLRKKCIHRFTNFARNSAESTDYFEKCFDFVASMVIAHEKGKLELQTNASNPLLPFGGPIKSEPDPEPTGLFVNIEECSDPLELYDENGDTL